uniref:Senescence domain-containing protein n=1 Tax=Haemonchus placei TaxID=6290 RepID=A0A0N4WGD1_HAEPC
LQTLIDRHRRQNVQQNGGWPSSPPSQRSRWLISQDEERARAEQQRAYEQQYQDRLRQQQDEARRRASCNPRPQPPPPAPQRRRNCLPRRTQELRLPPTPPPVPIRRNCRPRTDPPTYPPPPVYARRVNCRPTTTPRPPLPTPPPQRRTNCIPTYTPQRQQYYNCQPTYPPQPQRTPCYPSPPPQQPVPYNGCIPQRPSRSDDAGRGNEFRASPGCIAAPVPSRPDDCEGSVKIVSVNAAGKIEHYLYQSARDANEVLEQVGGKVADTAQGLAGSVVGAVGNAATSVKDHAAQGLQKTGEVIGGTLQKTGEVIGDAGAAVKDTASGAAHWTGPFSKYLSHAIHIMELGKKPSLDINNELLAKRPIAWSLIAKFDVIPPPARAIVNENLFAHKNQVGKEKGEIW